ncbi:30S ribosomal protein S17 [Candidatus Woesearchaeota archaeon]|nr:30S ribosomal protein S17 [Candidatus Woesearchaeota archaeon]
MKKDEKNEKQDGKTVKSEDKLLAVYDGIIPRGRTFVGKVVSDRMAKTVTVEWDRRLYSSKYERYEKRRTHVKAHNPGSINAKEGDVVEIQETRPLSKTKCFVVTRVLADEIITKSAESNAVKR